MWSIGKSCSAQGANIHETTTTNKKKFSPINNLNSNLNKIR